MTEEEAIEKLKECNSGDEERDHIDADRVLKDFLTSNGHEKLASEFDKINKWYA